MGDMARDQPPSGGCVLKLNGEYTCEQALNQPPSGGCVLKRHQHAHRLCGGTQPPSGGCVLKQIVKGNGNVQAGPAAFRRLCVETEDARGKALYNCPAAFRRLCVETDSGR